MTLQSNYNIQFFLFCNLSSLQHFSDTSRISCHRFFHEYMFTLFNRFFKMNRTETRRCSQYHHIGQCNCFFISIKTMKFIFFRNINPVFKISRMSCYFREIIGS